MSLNINDIDVFVMSYNRQNFITQTINSILNQTISPNKITIFDNGSTDSTIKKIEDLQRKEIKIIKSPYNNGPLWNFNRAVKAANSKYTILFHDDDIIHIQYLEQVLKVLNKYNEIGLVCSGMNYSKNPEKKHYNKMKFMPIYFKNEIGIAAMAYSGFPINFSSSVYKTEILKKVKLEVKKYQKIADRPLMFNVAKKDGVVILPGQFIFYRLHDGQDSKNSKTGPFEEHLIELHRKYYEILKNSNFLFRIVFYCNLKFHISNERKNLNKTTLINYQKKVFKELNLSNIEIILIHLFSVLKINMIFKVFRLIKRSFSQYS